jgi:hypothetical protein
MQLIQDVKFLRKKIKCFLFQHSLQSFLRVLATPYPDRIR